MPSHTSAERIGTFAQNGKNWTISYDGNSFSLKDVKGLKYLHFLLQHPGKEFHAIDLVQGPDTTISAADAAPNISELTIHRLGDAGEMLDPQAKHEYRHRLRELRADLVQLRECGDTVHGEKVEAEIDFIERELVRAVGLGGRDRRAGSVAERARLNVTRAIKSALKNIAEHHRVLGEMLESSIKTGLFSIYAPGHTNAISWRWSLHESNSAPDRTALLPESPRFDGAQPDLIPISSSFVGREKETAALCQRLDQARRGSGGIVLISGTAGVGKTWLARRWQRKPKTAA